MLFFSFILMVLVLFAAWREHKAASSDSDKEMGARSWQRLRWK
jgi:hypothetical protein